MSTMSHFNVRYETELVKLHKAKSTSESSFKTLLEQYGERPTTDSEEVFNTIGSFVRKYKASLEIQSKPKEEKKESVGLHLNVDRAELAAVRREEAS